MSKPEEIRSVGPVMNKGEMGDAVIEAIYEDNSERKIVVEEHASYFRVKVEGECLLRLKTVSDMLGSKVILSDIESSVPSFEGFIRVDSDKIRFLSS